MLGPTQVTGLLPDTYYITPHGLYLVPFVITPPTHLPHVQFTPTLRFPVRYRFGWLVGSHLLFLLLVDNRNSWFPFPGYCSHFFPPRLLVDGFSPSPSVDYIDPLPPSDRTEQQVVIQFGLPVHWTDPMTPVGLFPLPQFPTPSPRIPRLLIRLFGTP